MAEKESKRAGKIPVRPSELKEIETLRTESSKTYDLGGGKRLLRQRIKNNVSIPTHFTDKDGKQKEIDLSSRLDGGRHVIDQAPFNLVVDSAAPAYRYNGKRGEISVELVEIGGESVERYQTQSLGKDFRWGGIAKDTDYIIQPTRSGVSTYFILYGPDAPREWSWEIIGDRKCLAPITGKDAKGRPCLLKTRFEGDRLIVEWSGIVLDRKLRNKGESPVVEPVYPILIDPSVNESVPDTFNDISTMYFAGFGYFGSFYSSASYPYIFARFNSFAANTSKIGLRFEGINIPSGATIDSADITVTLSPSYPPYATPVVYVYGGDEDDAPAWVPGNSGHQGPQNMPKTAAYAVWSPGTNSATAFDNDIDVTSVVQEIVNRPGWSSGNDMRFGMFLADGNPFSDARVGIYSWGYYTASSSAPTTKEATLDIVYTEPVQGALTANTVLNFQDFPCPTVQGGVETTDTILLIHCDGDDASTTFKDVTANQSVITAVGTAQVDTAQSKFGGGSLLLDGDSDYLSVADGSVFNSLWENDATVDMWIRMDDLPGTAVNYPLASHWDDYDNGWIFSLGENSGLLLFAAQHQAAGSSQGFYYADVTALLSADTWHHVAYEKFNDVAYFYIDGNVIGATQFVAYGSFLNVDPEGPLRIGVDDDTVEGVAYFSGWIDEVRISKAARYKGGDFCVHTFAYTGPSEFEELEPPLFSNSNTFYQPTATASADLTPSLFSDADTVYSHTAASFYALAAPLFSDSDTFNEVTVAATYDLTPALYSDDDTFYSATVVSLPVDLTPSLFADDDTFYQPTVAPGAVSLTAPLYADGDTFYAHAIGSALIADLYEDGDTFYSATVTPGEVDVAPDLYSDSDTFHASQVDFVLAADTYADADTFFTATVSPGAIDLTPSLYEDADTFYSASVAFKITAPLFTDADTFYSATVVPGTTDLSPALFTDGGAFFTPLITQVVAPEVVTDADSFFAPEIGLGMVVSKFTPGATFHPPYVERQIVDRGFSDQLEAFAIQHRRNTEEKETLNLLKLEAETIAKALEPFARIPK